jgi:ribosomal protein L37AE/L43A
MLVKIDKDGANIVPDGAAKVRVCFEMDQTGSNLEAVFECLACGDLLVSQGTTKVRWTCPSCTYELHPMEAALVVRHARFLLDRMSEVLVPVKGKKQWVWVVWLLRLLRLKAA